MIFGIILGVSLWLSEAMVSTALSLGYLNDRAEDWYEYWEANTVH